MGETETIEKESVKRRALMWNQEVDSKEDASVAECAQSELPAPARGFFPHTVEPVPRVVTGSSFHSFHLILALLSLVFKS